MDFLGPDPNTSTEYVEYNKAFQDSHGASAFSQHELRERDLLRQLEEHSSENSDCSVDCTLKLGLPSETTTLPLRNDQNPPIGVENIYDIPQVMENNYGMVNGGCSMYNRWGSLGSGHLNWLPYSYGEMRDGLGYYGSSSMGVPSTSIFLNMEYARLSALALQQGSFPLSRLFAKKPEDGFTGRVRKCAECETTTTPLWRNGPKGTKSLCNACGIRYKKEERRALGIPDAYARAKGGALKEPESSKKPQN